MGQLILSNVASSNSSSDYRPDIDGLRGVAIACVVLFHSFPEIFSGGFVGVDVFFVISGYVITRTLIRDADAGNFSIAAFYRRRVRRLFPALFVVLIASLILGSALLLPKEFGEMCKTIAAGAGFFSNFILAREVGYFDSAAQTKPLLHLWSLSIEEQFYFVWPFFLLFLMKRRRAPEYIAATSLISLATCIFQERGAYAFYMPIPRFWELLVGCGLAYCEEKPREVSSWMLRVLDRAKHRADAVSTLGFLSILIALFLFPNDRESLWWERLLPTIGAALIISSGAASLVNQRLLSRPLLVSLGLVSYSLYLWHWPTEVFTRAAIGDIPAAAQLLVIAAALLLSVITYRFVERPLRTSASPRLGLRYFLTPMVLLIAVASVETLRYLPVTIPKSDRALVPCSGKYAALGVKFCAQSMTSTPTAVVFGDSHADHFFAGVAADQKRSWLELGNNSCAPLYALKSSGLDVPDCERRVRSMIDEIVADQNLKLVAFVFYGGYFLGTDVAADHISNKLGPSHVKLSYQEVDDKEQAFFLSFAATVGMLERAHKQIAVVIDNPELPFFPRDCISVFASIFQNECNMSLDAVLARQAQFRQILTRLQESHPDVRIFDSLDVLCPNGRCDVKRDGAVLYEDSHHLSAAGANLVAASFIDWIAGWASE